MQGPDNTGIREFLIEKVIKNYSGIFDQQTSERLTRIRREKVTVPVIYIATGTCGVIAGALQTLDAIRKFVLENKPETEIVETGCNGFCSNEPLVDVQLPGKTRLSFHNVTADKVEDLLNSIFHHSVQGENVTGQHRFPGLKRCFW